MITTICDKDITPEDRKARVRAWLYQWLSCMELQDIEEATRTQGRETETIIIKFGRG